REFGIGLAIVVVTAACLAAVWFTKWRRLRIVALVVVPVLIAVQGLVWTFAYYPHSRHDNFYPTNAIHSYLAANLGHERFFGTAGTIYGSVETIHGLRQFSGHGFMDRAYGELADALPGKQFLDPPNPATSIRPE